MVRAKRKKMVSHFGFSNQDPDHHIRVRFHGKDLFYHDLLAELSKVLSHHLTEGLVHRLQVDTYKREIERYGIHTVTQSEEIFWRDSELVLNFLGLMDAGDEMYRWLFALRGIDNLMNCFGFNLQQKAECVEELRTSFFLELNGTKDLSVQLDLKYRTNRITIWDHMDEGNDYANGFDSATENFKNFSVSIAEPVATIKKTLADKGPIAIKELSKSYIHMFLNRLLLSNHRKQELVIYHFISKYYHSIRSRESQKAASGSV